MSGSACGELPHRGSTVYMNLNVTGLVHKLQLELPAIALDTAYPASSLERFLFSF